jgi:hypothetical protein
MRGKTLAATALTIGAVVLAAGCGSGAAPGAASGGTDRARTTHAKCVTVKLTGQDPRFTVGVADNGKSFCITDGTGVFVFLHGTAAHKWATIQPSSAALQRRPSGVMMLTLGTTGGYFVAVRPGVASLTSSRRPCQATTCTAQVFRVTLVISGRA